MMQRILGLLESQESRISALESGTRSTSGRTQEDWARSALDPARTEPSADEELKALNLPTRFDVRFYEGSARLTLTAQLQLNEVIEYMGMYPQLRWCARHADVTGDRAAIWPGSNVERKQFAPICFGGGRIARGANY